MAADRRLIWSPEALGDLTDIGITTRRSPADGIVLDIGVVVRLLEDHPYGGRARDEVRLGLRSIAKAPHVVFYRVNADEVAQIVRILDGRRDIDAIFDA
jgi:toxin ParE1/3/4